MKNEETITSINRRNQCDAEKDERFTSKVEYPLLTNTHKHDEILSDYGDGKSEEQEIDDIAGKYFTTDNTKLKQNK